MKLIDEHKDRFEELFELYMDWNSKINLSAIRDRDGVYEKHFEDSLLLTDFYNLDGLNILDLGAGGGFPTLPLALVTPTASFTALDSVGKKMKVVQSISDELGLKNVKTMHGRFEDFGQDKAYREQYDLVIARAVAPWPVLLEYALPFVKIGGGFIAYQGPELGETLTLSRRGEYPKGVESLLGGKITQVEKMMLGENERYFIAVEKRKESSKKYPRINGIPRKEPLEK